MLQDVELVEDNLTVRAPELDAVGEWPPHIHTSRFDVLPLAFLQLRLISGGSP